MPDEEEQLKRLRERQLADRDPHVKTRKRQQFNAERERKIDHSVSPIQAWQTIPRFWRSVTLALLVFGLGMVILPAIWDSSWAIPVAILIAVIYLVFAVIIGNALDTRDEIKRLTK